MYRHTNYLAEYGRIMQFNKNYAIPIHRWYPFVEGYSKDFILSIINEVDKREIVCLDPFSGSGTTALELQNLGIKCYSFEVNPFMYLVGKVKLENTYELDRVIYWNDFIKKNRNKFRIRKLDETFPTLFENKNSKRFNYYKGAAIGIKKIQYAIEEINDQKYKDLFTVALSAILINVSNLYRNGKCLSYKRNWITRKVDKEDVFLIFDRKVKNEIIEDIKNFSKKSVVNNGKLLYNEDSRRGLQNGIEDNSIDLVITSPPYLNSRDYTDTYMLELKTLGFVNSFNDLLDLRKKTLRSHVQIKWDDNTSFDNQLLNKTINELNSASMINQKWNASIIDMVRLYFVDIKTIFEALYRKTKRNGLIYFNVSNSAYYNTLINTLDICASIAENVGFRIIEIRDARYINSSPQQKKTINKLLEGVIVMEKK